MCIAMELLRRNYRVLWLARECFETQRKRVLPVPKTSTLLVVGVRCVSQWNCFEETRESCGLRDSVFET